MLQTIHEQTALPRASSLYCVWIPSGQESGPPLIALWIDDEMRAFEPAFVPEVPADARGEVWNEQVR